MLQHSSNYNVKSFSLLKTVGVFVNVIPIVHVSLYIVDFHHIFNKLLHTHNSFIVWLAATNWQSACTIHRN